MRIAVALKSNFTRQLNLHVVQVEHVLDSVTGDHKPISNNILENTCRAALCLVENLSNPALDAYGGPLLTLNHCRGLRHLYFHPVNSWITPSCSF